jgi:hypothetical protein
VPPVGRGSGTYGPEPGDWAPPIPAAIFLDSSVVIDLDAYGSAIWDGEPLPRTMPDQHRSQVEALRVLMVMVERAGIACAVSPEVVREAHGDYVLMLADHWDEARVAMGVGDRGLPPMTLVADLPPKDRLVIAQAYRSSCEVVLTNDQQWMRAKHRRTLAALGIEAHTPVSLLDAVRPWIALWL